MKVGIHSSQNKSTLSMKHWGINDWYATLIAAISGIWAFFKGLPFDIEILGTGFWPFIYSHFLELCWSAFVALVCTGVGYIGKKIIDEHWKYVRAFIYSKFRWLKRSKKKKKQ